MSACVQTPAADAEEVVQREALEAPATVVLRRMEQAATAVLVKVASVTPTPTAATTVGMTSALSSAPTTAVDAGEP